MGACGRWRQFRAMNVTKIKMQDRFPTIDEKYSDLPARAAPLDAFRRLSSTPPAGFEFLTCADTRKIVSEAMKTFSDLASKLTDRQCAARASDYHHRLFKMTECACADIIKCFTGGPSPFPVFKDVALMELLVTCIQVSIYSWRMGLEALNVTRFGYKVGAPSYAVMDVAYANIARFGSFKAALEHFGGPDGPLRAVLTGMDDGLPSHDVFTSSSTVKSSSATASCSTATTPTLPLELPSNFAVMWGKYFVKEQIKDILNSHNDRCRRIEDRLRNIENRLGIRDQYQGRGPGFHHHQNYHQQDRLQMQHKDGKNDKLDKPADKASGR